VQIARPIRTRLPPARRGRLQARIAVDLRVDRATPFAHLLSGVWLHSEKEAFLGRPLDGGISNSEDGWRIIDAVPFLKGRCSRSFTGSQPPSKTKTNKGRRGGVVTRAASRRPHTTQGVGRRLTDLTGPTRGPGGGPRARKPHPRCRCRSGPSWR